MSTSVTTGVKYNQTKPQPFSYTRSKAGPQYGSFLVKLVDKDNVAESSREESGRRTQVNKLDVPKLKDIPAEDSDTEGSSMSVAVSRRSMSPRNLSPRGRASSRRRRLAYPEYDARLDNHQQTYVLSAITLEALRKTVKNSQHRIFSDPNKNVAFHGPRKPLLLSYPVKPSRTGKAIYITRPLHSPRSTDVDPAEKLPHLVTAENIPDTEDAHDFVRLAYNLRTGSMRYDSPIPKKLRRPKTVAPAQTKAQQLAKEKGFILDGIALSNIQDDYSKVQPKLGPAIPPYNSHFDKHVGNYFRFEGVRRTLRRTGQDRQHSNSTQGNAVDRFHHIGDGHIYIQERNRSGAGYSRESVDGHGQFLAEPKPMDGYNGKFGFRRNTPLLRNCPSPFGTASRSPTH